MVKNQKFMLIGLTLTSRNKFINSVFFATLEPIEGRLYLEPMKDIYGMIISQLCFQNFKF